MFGFASVLFIYQNSVEVINPSVCRSLAKWR
jgi:hypothetical protein